MSKNRPDFQPAFERLAETVGLLLKTACNKMNALEYNIFDVLDKQIVNRLLSQYDNLVKAGLSHQEALDAVTDIVRRRLETATRERAKQ